MRARRESAPLPLSASLTSCSLVGGSNGDVVMCVGVCVASIVECAILAAAPAVAAAAAEALSRRTWPRNFDNVRRCNEC